MEDYTASDYNLVVNAVSKMWEVDNRAYVMTATNRDKPMTAQSYCFHWQLQFE